MGGSILKDKSFAFAIRMVRLGDYLDSTRQYCLKDQVVKSGTSIGANVREARNAQGPKDMVSKFSIALKEADETMYWLELLRATDKITDKEFDSLTVDLNEVISMWVSSIKTLKDKLNKNDNG